MSPVSFCIVPEGVHFIRLNHHIQLPWHLHSKYHRFTVHERLNGIVQIQVDMSILTKMYFICFYSVRYHNAMVTQISFIMAMYLMLEH